MPHREYPEHAAPRAVPPRPVLGGLEAVGVYTEESGHFVIVLIFRSANNFDRRVRNLIHASGSIPLSCGGLPPPSLPIPFGRRFFNPQSIRMA
jgi:hypothetical protein